MLRYGILLFTLACLATLPAGSAGAESGIAEPGTPPELFHLAKSEERIRKCKALNECRAEFTRCYYAIKDDPEKSWDTHERECAEPYEKCIDRNFEPFEMFFTRMFDPRVQDCGE